MPRVCARPSPTCRSPKASRSRAAIRCGFRSDRRLVIPGDNADPRDHAGRRLRQHGGGRRPLLRATGAEREAQRAFRRQPPGDDPETLAQSACQRRGILRPRNHERHVGGWDWFGHSGGFQGYISRTCRHPRLRSRHHRPDQLRRRLGRFLARRRHAHPARLRGRGAPSRRVRDWTGRWWSMWGAADLVPVGNRVIVANPHCCSIRSWMRRKSRSPAATPAGSRWREDMPAMASPCAGRRNKAGTVTDIWLAGSRLKPEKTAGGGDRPQIRATPTPRAVNALRPWTFPGSWRSRQGPPRSYRRPRAHPLPPRAK